MTLDLPGYETLQARDGAAPRPRVLVVDDEAEALDGLRHVLRRACDVVGATSGVEALERLSDGSPFHVIVTDMRMPGMDGVRLLREAQVRCPDTIRMLLTGHADLETSLRAVNDGHVFRILLKPCPPDILRRAIEDGVEQYRLVTADKVLLEQKLQAMSAQLLHADRLASLGTLAGGVGHELKNIVTVLGLLMHMMKVGSVLRQDEVDMLRRVYDHVSLHAGHLLDLGRPQGDQEGVIDLRESVGKTLDLLDSVKRTRSTDVVAELGDEALWVPLSFTHCEQIVINLVGNAIDAMAETPPERRRVRVTLEPSAASVTCHVRDSGCGIPPERLDAIFEPYYTTKPPDRGTGLGLPVVKQLVEAAGGTLSVRSTVGEGTCFSLTLPRSDDPSALDVDRARGVRKLASME